MRIDDLRYFGSRDDLQSTLNTSPLQPEPANGLTLYVGASMTHPLANNEV
jgi:hypothetical protein